MTNHHAPNTIEADERRVDEWTRTMLHGWPYDETPLEDAMRAAARRAIHHAEREYRTMHPPFTLTFTGAPSQLGNTMPVTHIIHASIDTTSLEATLERLGIAERGALVGLARAILAADEALAHPLRWVTGIANGSGR